MLTSQKNMYFCFQKFQNMYKQILALVFSFLFTTVYAQSSDEVLLTINDHNYTVADFERVYTKNLDLLKDESQKDLDNYMDLYVLYQLKVQKAYALDLDEKESYKEELDKHRRELAEKYFTDEKQLDKLVKEAFDRSAFEREASHILIRIDQFASPQDTLKAYQKAMEVYEKAQSEADFGELAVEYSEDPSAKQNKGYLGYFTVFRMVYPFESAAFETPIGEVSKPVRSRFGYHIIKVTDEKPIRYFRSISLIRINEADFADANQAEEMINKAYSELKQGKPIEEVSEHYVYGAKNGFRKIEKFYPGSLSVQGLDDKVYEMIEGQYTKPFSDRGSWYIVQLDKILPMPTYEESYANIRRRVISDSRAQVLKKDLNKHLQEKYQFKTVSNALQSVFNLYKGKTNSEDWTLPTPKNADETIATYDGGQFTAGELSDFLNKRLGLKADFTISETYLNNEWEEFVSYNLKKNYDANLENMFPEFKYTVQEYREGLLLFDLMEQEIWTKAQQDTLAQQTYFQNHAEKYEEPAKIVGALMIYDTEKEAEKAMKFYQKNHSYEKTVEKHQPENWYKGDMAETDERLKNSKKPQENAVQVFPVKSKFALLIVEDYVPAKIPDWKDVETRVAYDYQSFYETEWNNELKQNAKIVINQSAFDKLKQKYQQ